MLCGGLVELMKAGYETLVEAGYAPEMAYFECMHEVKLIVDLIYEGGIANMNYSVSNTAEYGEYVSGPRVITPETRAEMKSILDDIQSGRFTRDWMLENKVNQTSFKATRAKLAEHPIEQVGAKLREMMPWIKQRALVDKQQELTHAAHRRHRAAALIGAAAFAFAGDQGEPDEPATAATSEIVDCLKAQTAQWDKRMTIAYRLRADRPARQSSASSCASRNGCGSSTATPIACITRWARAPSRASRPAVACWR